MYDRNGVYFEGKPRDVAKRYTHEVTNNSFPRIGKNIPPGGGFKEAAKRLKDEDKDEDLEAKLDNMSAEEIDQMLKMEAYDNARICAAHYAQQEAHKQAEDYAHQESHEIAEAEAELNADNGLNHKPPKNWYETYDWNYQEMYFPEYENSLNEFYRYHYEEAYSKVFNEEMRKEGF